MPNWILAFWLFGFLAFWLFGFLAGKSKSSISMPGHFHPHHPSTPHPTPPHSSPVPILSHPRMLESLPTELIHFIVFSFDISAESTLSLSLTSHALYTTLFGPLGNENAYDLAQFRAKGGLPLCVRKGWVRGALLALSRGFKDPSAGFCWAAKCGHLDVVKFLLSTTALSPHTIHPGANENEAIQMASYIGHPDVVSFLLSDPRVDPTSQNNLALRLAACSGNVDCLALLLAHPHVDPSDKGNDALYRASLNGHVEAVYALLQDPRVDPRDRDNRAIVAALGRNHYEIVNILVAHA